MRVIDRGGGPPCRLSSGVTGTLSDAFYSNFSALLRATPVLLPANEVVAW
jgi:hypothetical protein